MSGSYTAEQRRALEALLGTGEPLRCPACGTLLSQQKVEPTAQVAYVRNRIWVLCPACRRSAALDARG